MDKKFNLFVLVALLLTLSIGSFGLSQGNKTDVPLQLQGKYITSDSEAVFTFVGDSLYIDCAGSGCGIHAFRLKYNDLKHCDCDAIEEVHDPETGNIVKEKHHIVFKCGKDRIYVIGDNEIKDILIKMLP